MGNIDQCVALCTQSGFVYGLALCMWQCGQYHVRQSTESLDECDGD